jgi:predicted transcriptional regulator
MNVLLSIKPKYAELIKSGLKKYEFRRKIFKKAGGCKVFIYSTSPVKKITGVFDASIIHQDSPYRIWDMFGAYSGISEGEFFQYFRDCEIAYAIEYNGPQNLDSEISYTWEIKGGGPSGTNAKEVSAFI